MSDKKKKQKKQNAEVLVFGVGKQEFGGVFGACPRVCFSVCRYLGDVVEVSEDAELFRLQFGLKVSSDDGNVVNDQLQAARR